MPSRKKEKANEIVQCFRRHGPFTLHSFLVAPLIWLFGVLIFIPMANSINWQTGLFCSSVVLVAFTIFIYRAISGLKEIIDAFSVLPAKKYGLKRGINYEDAITLFRCTFYIIPLLLFYALFFPLLMSIHPTINSIILILTLIWVFFFALKILSILSPKILGWFEKQ